jgi:Tfp pilus assembly protein PilO
MDIMNVALSILALVMTLVNGWLVFVLKGLQAQIDDVRKEHVRLREKQSNHETKVAERTLTRDEFKTELAAQTLQLTTLMNAAIRNIK